MQRLATLALLGLSAAACVSADGPFLVRGRVLTPDARPLRQCSLAVNTSRKPPTESYRWRPFSERFQEFTLTQYKREFIHVACPGWRPFVGLVQYDKKRGWTYDSVQYFAAGDTIDMGTIVLAPLP